MNSKRPVTSTKPKGLVLAWSYQVILSEPLTNVLVPYTQDWRRWRMVQKIKTYLAFGDVWFPGWV